MIDRRRVFRELLNRPSADRQAIRRGPATGGSRAGISIVPVLIYLAGFVVILLFVSHYYLLPAIQAASGANEAQKRILSASASLILALVLFVLLAGLLLTFRIGRFFRPLNRVRPKPTQYIDAWEESGRRMKTPQKDE